MRKNVILPITAFISGLIFSFGLVLSEMINPARVQGFLDIFGTWDPSLMFVLGGAIPVAFIGVHIMKIMPKPVFAQTFDLPTKTKIDRPLLLGSALFGIGWGIGGLCPAPAIASLSTLLPQTIIFVLMMVLGMLLHDKLWKSLK